MNATNQDCHLAIFVRDGQVESVVTDCVERFSQTNILVIDTRQPQLYPLEETEIDLADLASQAVAVD